MSNIFTSHTVPNQTTIPHDHQKPTTLMPGTTTDNRSVQNTLTHSMQPPHPIFCEYIEYILF